MLKNMSSTSTKSLALLLKKRREELFLSQEDVSTQVHLSKPGIQKIESIQNSNPSVRSLIELADCLGLEIQIKPKSIYWSKLISWGVPLSLEADERDYKRG
jgi:transcriptional regulator with XRE-family HTH domain